jgi:hypothetical protein
MRRTKTLDGEPGPVTLLSHAIVDTP